MVPTRTSYPIPKWFCAQSRQTNKTNDADPEHHTLFPALYGLKTGTTSPFDFAMPILRAEKVGWVFWELLFGKTQFSRDNNSIQGLVCPGGTCRDAREVAAVMNLSVEEAKRLFRRGPARRRPSTTNPRRRLRLQHPIWADLAHSTNSVTGPRQVRRSAGLWFL